MKKFYVSPNMQVEAVRTNKMLAGSWDKDDTSGIDPTPGSQGSFGSKEEELDFVW